METKEAQKKVLHIFAGKAKTFALSGGTALGIYYLKHRSSADLDFFSPEYNLKEINELVGTLKKALECKVKLETDFVAADRGRVRLILLRMCYLIIRRLKKLTAYAFMM
jgi:hypothetical protein